MPNDATPQRPLDDIGARAAQLERRRENAPDEATARRAADELHALMDAFDNVAEMPGR